MNSSHVDNMSRVQPEQIWRGRLDSYYNLDNNGTYGVGILVLLVMLGGCLLVRLVHHLLLPRPIPGIPYIQASANNIMGDIPAMTEHIKATDGTFVTYLRSVMERLNSPVVQVFMFPFQKPLVLLGDFAEAQDMLLRREAEFERSATLGDLLLGILPSHHVHLPTGSQWKAQRLLIRDLMTPSFLHGVAGPILYKTASDLVELWCTKARLADGRPFAAGQDIYHFALDAMSAFTFGHGFDHGSLDRTWQAVQGMIGAAEQKSSKDKGDAVVSFPQAKVADLMWAFMELTELVAHLLGNPFPRLAWAYLMRKPATRRAKQIKERFIRDELQRAVHRLGGEGEGLNQKENKNMASSAVDYMVAREKVLAEKAGRRPDYYSAMMIDEIFGIVYTGHETTSTMLSWAVKYLADAADAQKELRAALHSRFAEARAAGRSPTVDEITSRQVPWLEATIEECLRCASVAPSIDRVAVADTQILGYRIPRGTVVAQPCSGPSITTPAFDTVDDAMRSPTSLAARRQKGLVPPNWSRESISTWNPERWLVRSDDDDTLQFNPNAGPQIAFGLGTRGCYGKRLTYVEARILLTLLVWNFDFLPCPLPISRYSAKMTTANAPRDCFVRLRERNVEDNQ